MYALTRTALRRAPRLAHARPLFVSAPRRDASAERYKELAAAIMDLAGKTPDDRKAALADKHGGDLHEILELSDASQLDDLRPVLRSWAEAGGPIDKKTAAALVAKCIQAGKKELAAKLMSDPKYGLPQPAEDGLARLESLKAAESGATIGLGETESLFA